MQGRGARLWDERGVSYLDTRNNVAHVGHCHPVVVRAVQEQVAQLNTNTRYLHPTVTRLARALVDDGWLPPPLTRVFFVNSGSEANDLALRLARAHSGGSVNTITIDHAYHGHTLGTLEVSPYKYECGTEPYHSHQQNRKRSSNSRESMENKDLDSLDVESPSPASKRSPGSHIWKVPCPDTYRGLHRSADTPDPATAYASYVENACEYFTSRGEKVRAMIVEGGMSVAGVIIPPPGYLALCSKAVRAAGGLYIADEVQTGLGRFGSSVWAFQHGAAANSEEAVVPDILTVGKPFGNGMSLALVATTDAVAQAFEDCQVEYFNTFGGNPVCAAAGLAVLQVLQDERLLEHAAVVGAYLQERLRAMEGTTVPWIGQVRGQGLFIGVELVRDRLTLEPATAETSFLVAVLKDQYRILTSIDGPFDNVIVIKPPMVFSQDDADYFCDSLEKAVMAAFSSGDLGSVQITPT
jgi:ethanolamine-phosphate phospho-lyase